jgi:hypothetical protein
MIGFKQLTSVNAEFGKILISDGNSKFILSDISGLTTVIGNGTSFPSNPSGVTMFYRTDADLLFYYDDNRSKWLTIERHTLTCGRTTAASGSTIYMRVGDATQNSTSGFRMIRNGTIIGASIQNDNILTTSKPIEIRINNSVINKVDIIILSGTTGGNINNINLDFNLGDIIQVVSIPSTPGSDLSNVIIIIDVSYRI